MRTVRSNGLGFNVSDYLLAKSLADVGVQSVLGRAYALSYRMTIPADGEEDILLEVPEGVKVFFHSRLDEVVGGQLEWELRVNPDPGYVAEETKKGSNYNAEVGGLSQATTIRTAAPTTGSIFLREGINYPPGTGSNSSSNVAFEESGAVPSFVNGTVPLIRFKNTNSTSMLVIVNWVWSEVPLEYLGKR